MSNNFINNLTAQEPSRSYVADPFANRKYLCPKCNSNGSAKMLGNLVEFYQRRTSAFIPECDLCEESLFTPEDAASSRRIFFCRRCNVAVCPRCQKQKLKPL